MKKKIKLKKRTIQKLQLKLKLRSDHKVAPMLLSELVLVPSNGAGGAGCTRGTSCQ
jgi:hypothetical protein